MQIQQAIFIVGSPGSGKDKVIKDISSTYNIVEYSFSSIDSMLSDDVAFKRAKYEKRNSLLESKSILITANSYDLSFVITKSVLESLGYTTHLILVEANVSIAYDRLKNRDIPLSESFTKISSGNSNKLPILREFPSNVIVDNSTQLDLSESREFVYNILSDLTFESSLKLSDIIKPKFSSKIFQKYNVESSDSPSFDTAMFGSPEITGDNTSNIKSTLAKTKKILFKNKVIPNGI